MPVVLVHGPRRGYIQISTLLLSCLIGKMAATRSITTEIQPNHDLLQRARAAVPSLNANRHKGQAGIIGVVGGSMEYTGAPYYAAISALKTGADLVSVFCAKDAAIPIKSYSPDLMVYPIFDTSDASDPNEQTKSIEALLGRLHVLVIGPGLGRHPKVLLAVSHLIEKCRTLNKPLILDADATYLVSQNVTLIKDYPAAIVTPNVYEFQRIFGADETLWDENINALGAGVTILEKGQQDTIYNNKTKTLVSGGSGRRCGGQGDILSGCAAIFYDWCLKANETEPAKVAAFAASYMVKRLNEKTFAQKGRSMTASDMIDNIGIVFQENFEL